MKKLIAIILNIFLACSLFIAPKVTVKAEGTQQGAFALKFVLTADNQSVVLANTDDIITVTFTMQRTDSTDDYMTNGFQNYINYDLSFFEFVEGSIVCYDTGSATAQKLTSLTYGEIIQCSNMGKSYPANFVFCTFQLKVIGTAGSGIIKNGEVYAFDSNFQEVTIEEQSLEVIVSECAHANKTNVAAKAPTCTENGWEAYGHCPDCGYYFTADGSGLLPGVPSIPAAHTPIDEVLYDETGHWYACSVCEDKVDYAEHSGGEASCKAKAKCETCAQEYGEIDPHNHVGETYVENKKAALPWESGYTGDVYCSDCQQLVQQGEIDNSWDTAEWLLRIIIIAIILLLFLAAVVCLLA